MVFADDVIAVLYTLAAHSTLVKLFPLISAATGLVVNRNKSVLMPVSADVEHFSSRVGHSIPQVSDFIVQTSICNVGLFLARVLRSARGLALGLNLSKGATGPRLWVTVQQ